MEWNQRLETLVEWGKSIQNMDWVPYYQKIEQSNPWFTPDSVVLALKGIQRYLDPQNLNHWLQGYRYKSVDKKTIGIIMAGNIPLVGIHDLICCYLSGHKALIKPSSQDNILLKLLVELWSGIDPNLDKKISLVQSLQSSELDAFIATGSDNTSRYFKFHYNDIPGIIRSNRTSVAIIRGDENRQQLEALGQDVYSYFGRGCRNVSKLLVPAGYNFNHFVDSNHSYQYLLNNTKYLNNYRYQKALYSTQQVETIDTQFSLLVRSEGIVSPLATVYFYYYEKQSQLDEILDRNKEKIQCIASADGWYPKSLPFGSLQHPDLWDYADGIDTLEFLLRLN